MKVIEVASLEGTDREVRCPKDGFISYRMLLESDGMGFGFHKTVIPKGVPQFWHYQNHLEACYCVEGYGVLTERSTGKQHKIEPGTLYVLDEHDAHIFQALKATTLLCVFNPPLTGREVHDTMGSYPATPRTTR